ncbi:MAG: ABC transporter substrate-binding protein [Magnetococcales bacterium]|nr:ABC transporter substrate-binding protein [Magnetococcales bacterium]
MFYLSSLQKKLVTLAAVMLLLGLGYYWFAPKSRGEVYYLGIGGPMSGSFEDVGLSMRRGALLAIDEINASGELGDIHLEGVVVDDASDLEGGGQSLAVAKKLAQTENLLGVVGHYFSGATLEASEIYRENSIPLITPSATNPKVTSSNDWNFSVIQDDFYQAVFLANYVVKGLGIEDVGVIRSSSTYGRSLEEYFVRELRVKGQTPTAVVELDPNGFDPEILRAQLEPLKASGMIFLAMNYKLAAKVIKFLRDNDVNPGFVGAESLGGPHFIHEAGVYADNVYAVTPYLANLLGESSKHYQANYLEAYQVRPDWVATNSYEAVKLFATGIRNAGPDREGIRNHLRRIRNEEDALPSVSGPIYFNEEGASRRAIAMGQVIEGRYLPARFQLTAVKYPELEKARKQRSKAFQMGNTSMKRTTVVFTGLHVQEIKSFDPIDSNFVADFLLWFRWDPSQNKKLNFEMTHGKVLAAKVREKYFDKKTHNNFISYQVSARMEGQFPLHDYPFDRQILKIRIKPKVKNKEDLILVTDIPDDTFLRKHLDIRSWKDREHIHFTSGKEAIWSYRNPKYLGKLFQLDHSQYNYHIHLERDVYEYIIKLLPLTIIVLTAYSLFFINFEFTPSRFTVGITSMMSAMAFHNVNKLDVGYLVKSDIFFMMTYYLIFFSILETVLASSLHEKGKEEMAARLDHFSIVLYPVLIVFAVYQLFN